MHHVDNCLITDWRSSNEKFKTKATAQLNQHWKKFQILIHVNGKTIKKKIYSN